MHVVSFFQECSGISFKWEGDLDGQEDAVLIKADAEAVRAEEAIWQQSLGMGDGC